MNQVSDLALPDLLSVAASSVTAPSASQRKILERLKTLRERLAIERFQLAVLGQFKRGAEERVVILVKEVHFLDGRTR